MAKKTARLGGLFLQKIVCNKNIFLILQLYNITLRNMHSFYFLSKKKKTALLERSFLGGRSDYCSFFSKSSFRD